jgi:ParB family transcriptional regulator, chromosome partitioning protein
MMTGRRAYQSVHISAIEVPDGRRPLDEATVVALMESVELIGLQAPVTIRLVSEDGGKIVRYILAAGAHRLEACRRLRWKSVPAIVWEDWGEREARLAEIAENLHRHELSELERSKQVAEWIALTERQGVSDQVEQKPQGGRPAGGVSQAARDLGISRGETMRRQKIAGLTKQAQDMAVELGLDDNQKALLKARAAGEDTEAQVEALRAFATRKRGQSRSPRPKAEAGTEMPDAEVRAEAADELRDWWRKWRDEDFATEVYLEVGRAMRGSA